MAEATKTTNTAVNPRGPGAATGFSPERKKRGGSASEYKKSLVEKQTLKQLYGLSEKQFKRYVKEALAQIQKVENVTDELIKSLETRLDNVVFRLGFAKTRAQARQMVNHSYFLVNKRSVNIPSFQVEKGDIVSIKETKKKKHIFDGSAENLKKMEAPKWLKLDKESLSGEVVGLPNISEANPPVQIPLIFEFYSR